MLVMLTEKELVTELETLVDETVSLSAKIKALEEQKQLLKYRIEKEMLSRNIREIKGSKGKATYQEQERKTIEHKEVYKAFNIDETMLEKYTSIKNVKFIKIT